MLPRIWVGVETAGHGGKLEHSLITKPVFRQDLSVAALHM